MFDRALAMLAGLEDLDGEAAPGRKPHGKKRITKPAGRAATGQHNMKRTLPPLGTEDEPEDDLDDESGHAGHDQPFTARKEPGYMPLNNQPLTAREEMMWALFRARFLKDGDVPTTGGDGETDACTETGRDPDADDYTGF